MKERIITGLIMAFFATMAIVFLSTQSLAVALLLLMLVGAYEWARLMSLQRLQMLGFMITTAIIMIIGMKIIHSHALVFTFLGLVSIFWLSMPFILKAHAKHPLYFLTTTNVLLGISLLTLFGFFIGILMLHIVHPGYVFLLVLLVAGADSMAYFVGRKLGKRKLAPTISPGKSVEGAYAGIASGLIIGFIASFFIEMSMLQRLGFMILCGVMVVVSICGDLFESLIKRHAGVKDSGSILPGHGGILDRIDALTAAAPLFVCGLFFLEILK